MTSKPTARGMNDKTLLHMEKQTLNIFERLAAIQDKLKAPKDQYNSFGKYKYRSAEGILEAVKPLLKELNCTLWITDEMVEVGGRVYVKATACFTCTDTTGLAGPLQVSAYARESETKSGMDASQITGAASSYARKYALNGLFAIDDTKDADALNTSPEYTKPAPAPATKKDCPEETWWKLVKMEVEGVKSKTGLSGLQYLQAKYRTDETILAKFAGDVQMARDARETQDFLDLDESEQNPKNK